MTRSTDAAPLDFNPLDPAVVSDPYGWYRRLREQDPVHRSSIGMWYLTRYADVELVLRDDRFDRSGLRAALKAGFGGGPEVEVFEDFLFAMDPPRHTRLRRLVGQAFVPRRVNLLRTQVDQTASALLASLVPRGRIDFVTDFADHLPLAVICDILGIPVADRAPFAEWTTKLVLAGDATAPEEARAEGRRALGPFLEYFTGLIAQRRRAPGDALLDALIEAHDEGDELSDGELTATCVNLVGAGYETTASLIANAMHTFLTHPDQWALLGGDLGLLEGAVEEVARYDPSGQIVARSALEDVDVGGVRIPAGSMVSAVVGAANRDPARFADPDRFDIARQDNRHLTFGKGIHFCIGAQLARIETQAALAAVARLAPGISLADPGPAWRASATVRGLRSLPVDLAPSAERRRST